VLKKVLGVGDVRHWLYLAAKPSYVGVDVDGIVGPCTVLRPIAIRRGDMASCQALSCNVVL
jgi:hypothetical protein